MQPSAMRRSTPKKPSSPVPDKVPMNDFPMILLRISFVIFAIPVLGIRGYLYGLLLSEILLSLLHIYALYHMEF